jgi:hypothetical protein
LTRRGRWRVIGLATKWLLGVLNAVVEGNAELPAERLVCAKRGSDRHRDQAAGAGLELFGAGPAVAE